MLVTHWIVLFVLSQNQAGARQAHHGAFAVELPHFG